MTAALETDCKRILATLQIFTNDELNEIMDNEEKICTLIEELDQSYLKNVESEKEEVQTSINQLSDANLAREPELVEAREAIVLRSENGEELTQKVEEAYKTLRDKGGDMSMDTALALLQTAASEMEEESDKIAQSFLDNSTELDSFLDEFLIKRKLMHLRNVKAEKMSKLIAQDGIYSPGNYVNAPPMSINSSYFPAMPAVNPTAVPYPTGGMGMPMPPGHFFQNHY